jgi:hypothetical protein
MAMVVPGKESQLGVLVQVLYNSVSCDMVTKLAKFHDTDAPAGPGVMPAPLQ